MAGGTKARRVRATVKRIGYEQDGFHWEKFEFINRLHGQSAHIAQGVDAGENKDEGAGDQGIMFGYATDETPGYMPATLYYSHKILERMAADRKSGAAPFLEPDAKSQVTLRYANERPVEATAIVVSTQHAPGYFFHNGDGDEAKYTELRKYVLGNPYIWLLACCYVLVYVVRTAINDWGNLYMTEQRGFNLMSANSAISMFEVGGFIGALVAGWGSDKLFNGNRGPMNLIFAMGILLSVGSLWLMPFFSYVMQAACFFTIGFFVFGPQMLIGMAAAECSHKNSAGAATGFVGLFAYMGAALSGYPLAKVMEIWHWNGFFVVISVAAGVSALLLLPFLKAQAPRPLAIEPG